MYRPLAVGLAVVLLAGAVVAAGGSTTGRADAGPAAFKTAEGFDRTAFTIRVFANGSARWTFAYKRTLSNETERRRFRTYAERFTSREVDLYTTFKRRARALTALGSNRTGRAMSVRNFSRQASVNELGNQGVVAMSFVWVNFAITSDGPVTVGDVFEGGLYIGPDQRLVIEHGTGLVFRSVAPPPDSRADDSVTWLGERQFADNRPRVELVLPGATATPTPSAGESPGTTTTRTGNRSGAGAPGGGEDRSGDGLVMWLVGAAVVVVGLVAAVAWRAGGSAALGGTATGSSGAGAGEVEPAVPAPELLTDEDRVIKLLKDNGGRMKQTTIVDETGWSKSKVSMLLSEMEDAGQLSKLRVGRENIVSLAGHEPDVAGSPFDDDE